ncbi:hypothetical protein OCU04_012112 [Sclerotinia nivalis]|uniref:Uncharacterized protein n=1 Tax=Sclerotinia nivalis TaxID=352851 RepID=A0A9X0AAF0_9HELO|nr:hypothetical protein OCU04_012112 [Sclerotinia nivalis]
MIEPSGTCYQVLIRSNEATITASHEKSAKETGEEAGEAGREEGEEEEEVQKMKKARREKGEHKRVVEGVKTLALEKDEMMEEMGTTGSLEEGEGDAKGDGKEGEMKGTMFEGYRERSGMVEDNDDDDDDDNEGEDDE